MSYPDYEPHDSVDRTTTHTCGSGRDRLVPPEGPDGRHAGAPMSRDFSGYTSGPPRWPPV